MRHVVGFVRITTYRGKLLHKPPWNWVALKALGKTVRQRVRERPSIAPGGREHGQLYSPLIILSWTQFCGAFIRCTEPNPIGYQPNLQQKPCCLRSRPCWGLLEMHQRSFGKIGIENKLPLYITRSRLDGDVMSSSADVNGSERLSPWIKRLTPFHGQKVRRRRDTQTSPRKMAAKDLFFPIRWVTLCQSPNVTMMQWQPWLWPAPLSHGYNVRG